MARTGEREWVESIRPMIGDALRPFSTGNVVVRVETARRLRYAHEVLSYEGSKPAESNTASYETDLLVSDVHPDGRWVPRVIVECKTYSVTTHDALTYSNKAAAHRHVHPYLRYGILVGNYGTAVPARLARHGVAFDFMAVWGAPEPTAEEWALLVDVLSHEVMASRKLQALLTDRSRAKTTYRLVHRPLILK